MGSASVKALKEGLDGLIIRKEGSKYRQREEHVVINWGNSEQPPWLMGNILNHPLNIQVASNKLTAFRTLAEAGVATVDFTTDRLLAEDWTEHGHTVFVRTKLTGHSGDGIEIAEPADNEEYNRELRDVIERLVRIGYDQVAGSLEEDIVSSRVPLENAPLYTKAVDNNGEYRVHVMNGEVILYQKKSRRRLEDGTVATAEGEHAMIRNLASNWVYRTGNLKRLERIENLAIDAVKALGLDFGAVDIIKDEEGNVFVLEVNTAPGLGNTDTLEAYVNGFKNLY